MAKGVKLNITMAEECQFYIRALMPTTEEEVDEYFYPMDLQGGGSDDEIEVDGTDRGQKRPSEERDDDDDEDEEKRRRLDPFKDFTIVYQEGPVKILVRQVKHKKQTQYSIEDNLFEVSVKTDDSNITPPLLVSLEKGLKMSLIYLVDKLKDMYDQSENRQVYMTVCEKNILRGNSWINYW